MPRIAKELSPLEVGRLKEPGHHAVGGVAGLYLYITDTGGRSWVLRTVAGTKRRHMGLGAFPEVSLAKAREKAREAKEQIGQGADPIAERKAKRSAIRAEQAAALTFEQAAAGYIKAQGDAWKNAKHRQQWENTLAAYAHPIIGALHVRDISQAHLLAVLEPIWKTKTETATRVRGRIESVLDWATVRGHRVGDNPARWKGHLDKLLPAPRKVTKVEHHTALPIDAMGEFMAALRQQKGDAARALEFTILTAARQGEVRGMRWAEVDLDSKVWTVPADRMKAGKEHRVPLSEPLVAMLTRDSKQDADALVFPAQRGGQMSDMTMTAVLRRMEVDAVPHGFRSTFRDWAGERTNYPRDLAEQALAHTLESAVEAAYRRGDMLEKRRHMMQAWADFCGHVRTPGEVVGIGARLRA